MPRQVEHVAMPDEVRLHVGLRIFEAVANARLRAQVDDPVDLDRVGEGLERFGVGEVEVLEPEAVAELLLKLGEPRLFELGIVISAEAVDADDLVAPLEQGPRCRSADEPRSPGDQNNHGRLLGAAVRSAKALEASSWNAAGPSPSTVAGPSPTSWRERQGAQSGSKSCCRIIPANMRMRPWRRSAGCWPRRAAMSP